MVERESPLEMPKKAQPVISGAEISGCTGGEASGSVGTEAWTSSADLNLLM